MRSPVFTGACPALVTPFHESGGVNFAAFARQIEAQLAAGADALCVCGTTGESATLTERERAALIESCAAQVNGRVPVIAGTGSNSTAKAAEASRQAQALGADALLLVTPYYNKATQDGLLRHYETVTGQVDLPVILYNVPSRTGLSFTAETYAALARDPRINGVKEASGDFSLISHTLALCPADFTIWSGNDDQVVPMMALGAKGVISVACNLVPEVMVRLSHLCLDGDFSSAARLQTAYIDLIDTLFVEVNPIPVKAAMDMLGMEAGLPRLPLCPPSPAHQRLLRQVLAEYEL